MSFINHGGKYLNGGMEISASKNNYSTIEVQYGPDKKQFAHRFKVPDGSTSGVADSKYSYLDYVEVPFEVWDIENNKQLMVSFRDQDKNGEFNLTVFNDSLFIGREYVWINDVEYNEEPSELIMQDGGHVYEEIAFWWPVLADFANWDPENLPNSKIVITHSTVYYKELKSKRISHWWGADAPYVHADIHSIQFAKRNENGSRIVVANDGGLAFSDDNGVTWKNPTIGYNTTQFYGVDKHPYENRYIGGLQDSLECPRCKKNGVYSLQ